VVTIPFAGALGEVNKLIPIPAEWARKFKGWELDRETQEASFLKINSIYKYLLSMLIMAVLPAVFEEVYFRSGLQNILTRWFRGPWIAIILTSIIFSIIHLSYYGFLVRFGLGVILGMLFYYSKNVWLPILFHFLFNGIQVTFIFIMTMNGIKIKKDLEQSFPLWMGLIAIVALTYLFLNFKRKSAELQLRYVGDVPEKNNLSQGFQNHDQ
ncbi:MAG: CPBP family intramembrane glutamic endopeptidase, partial [Chitinophagaceae bacterium]